MKTFALLLVLIIMALANAPVQSAGTSVVQSPTTAPPGARGSEKTGPRIPIPPVERIDPADGALVPPSRVMKEEMRESTRWPKNTKDDKTQKSVE